MHNGRRTEAEHNRFIEGLKLYGKDWRLIEEHIGTRTVSQMRSHAQKYYLRLDKNQEER
jgi:MYB-related transcription factor LHY